MYDGVLWQLDTRYHKVKDGIRCWSENIPYLGEETREAAENFLEKKDALWWDTALTVEYDGEDAHCDIYEFGDYMIAVVWGSYNSGGSSVEEYEDYILWRKKDSLPERVILFEDAWRGDFWYRILYTTENVRWELNRKNRNGPIEYKRTVS